MASISDIQIPHPTEGVIRSAQLSDNICPENSVQLGINLHFDRIGSATTRLGVETFLTAYEANEIKSFGTLNNRAGDKKLFVQIGNKIYSWSGNSWDTERTLSKTNKARFSQFLNRVWMVNGSDGDFPMSSIGPNFNTTDVPASFPKADFIQAGYDGRVWVADASKDILYYTEIVQSIDGTTYVSPLEFDITKNFITKFSPPRWGIYHGVI